MKRKELFDSFVEEWAWKISPVSEQTDFEDALRVFAERLCAPDSVPPDEGPGSFGGFRLIDV
jgi:hypothetical protein